MKKIEIDSNVLLEFLDAVGTRSPKKQVAAVKELLLRLDGLAARERDAIVAPFEDRAGKAIDLGRSFSARSSTRLNFKSDFSKGNLDNVQMCATCRAELIPPFACFYKKTKGHWTFWCPDERCFPHQYQATMVRNKWYREWLQGGAK